jgi:2-polyprenyl-3-methyl-5-hydroxy-6-metoxy-1,4-benzoquinol methylase
MIQTKLTCDNTKNYVHRYSKEECEVSTAIAAHWWQIETHPGTLVISQPVVMDQIKSEAKHACSADCAKSIVDGWANENILDVIEEAKSEENIPS